MSEENLADGLTDSYRQHQREIAIQHLGARTHWSMGQIARLVSHETHGEVVATITLQELIDWATGPQDLTDAALKTTRAPEKAVPAKRRGRPPGAPKAKKVSKKAAAAPKKAPKAAAKKGPKAKKVSKKAAAAPKAPKAKKAPKAATPKAAADKGPKADKGKPKPRLDYDTGRRELLAALKTAKAGGHDSLGRAAIEEATGFTGVQVRTFAKKLAEEGKIQVLGEGGRSTTYALA